MQWDIVLHVFENDSSVQCTNVKSRKMLGARWSNVVGSCTATSVCVVSRHCAICWWGGREENLPCILLFPLSVSTRDISLPPPETSCEFLSDVDIKILVHINAHFQQCPAIHYRFIHTLTMPPQVKEFLGKNNWRFISTLGGSKPVSTSITEYISKTLCIKNTFHCCHYCTLAHKVISSDTESNLPPHTSQAVYTALQFHITLCNEECMHIASTICATCQRVNDNIFTLSLCVYDQSESCSARFAYTLCTSWIQSWKKFLHATMHIPRLHYCTIFPVFDDTCAVTCTHAWITMCLGIHMLLVHWHSFSVVPPPQSCMYATVTMGV